MKSFWIPLAGVLVLGSALPARADVAPAPCDGKSAGDACMTFDNKAGTCVVNPSSPGVLDCQETMAATGAGGAGGAGSSSSGAGGSSSGGGDDDSGCAVHPGPTQGAAGLLLLLAASALASRRRR